MRFKEARELEQQEKEKAELLERRSKFEEARAKEQKKQRVKELLAAADQAAMGSLFQMWDADGSGYVDRQEFREQLDALCHSNDTELSEQTFAAVWRDYDMDDSGVCSYDEWLRVAFRDGLAQGGSRIIDAFRKWDTDESGFIERAEFVAAVGSLGFEAPRVLVEEVFDSMDADSSGSLSFAELHKQIRQGSATRLARHLSTGGVAFAKNAAEQQRNSLRGTLVSQLTRHINTVTAAQIAKAAVAEALQPRAARLHTTIPARAPPPPPPTRAEAQSTSIWVLRSLTKHAPRRAASKYDRHTAMNDDGSVEAIRRQRALTPPKPRQRAKTPQRIIDVLADAEAKAVLHSESAAGGKLFHAGGRASSRGPNLGRPQSAAPRLVASASAGSLRRGGGPTGAASVARFPASAQALTRSVSLAQHPSLGQQPPLGQHPSLGQQPPLRPSSPFLGRSASASTLGARSRGGSVQLSGATSSSVRGSSPPSPSHAASTPPRGEGRGSGSRRRLPPRPSSSFVVRDCLKERSAQDMRAAVVPRSELPPSNERMTKIDRITNLHVPRTDAPHRSIDHNGLACWVRKGHGDGGLSWPISAGDAQRVVRATGPPT